MNEIIQAEEWISTGEAARLIRPPRGRRCHPSTICRLILAGKIQGRRRGHYYLVLKSEVLEWARGLSVAVARSPVESDRERKRREAWVHETLVAAGIRRQKAPDHT